MAIFAYSISIIYKMINASLSNNPKTLDDLLTNECNLKEQKQKDEAIKSISNLISIITSALERLPNNDTVLYRGAGLTPDQLATYKEGTIITSQRFSSASASVDEALKFLLREGKKENKVPVLFQIQSKTGKQISQYSVMPDEHETLFAPSTSFRVIGKQEERGMTIIQLEQVDNARS